MNISTSDWDTVTTDVATNEGRVLERVMESHQANTGQSLEMVVADKQYGTGENYRALRQRQVTPCIAHKVAMPPKGKLPGQDFVYDAQRDCFRCPGGKELRPYERDERRVRYRAAQGVCAACPLRSQYADSAQGRRLERHRDQDHIDWADAANNHGYKRARWRGRQKMTIQNLRIATCQNPRKLVKALTCGPLRPPWRPNASPVCLGAVPSDIIKT